MLIESATWSFNKESNNTQIHCRISPRRVIMYADLIISQMNISSRGLWLLIYIIKNAKTDSMGPFNRVENRCLQI